MLMYNAAFILSHSQHNVPQLFNHSGMWQSWSSWLKLDQDNTFLIQEFLRKFLTYKCWWWQLRQLKATWYTQEMAPQSMKLSTPLMIMRGKKSSEMVIWKWMNLAWSIDTVCAGGRENIIQLLWYFVMWEQPLLSELVHAFAVMFTLG